MDSNTIVSTVNESGLSSTTCNIVKKNPTSSLSKVGSSSCNCSLGVLNTKFTFFEVGGMGGMGGGDT